MIWFNPFAALGLLALAAPLLIHVLARQKAPQLAFPTLRFLRPSAMAAMRRRAIDDLALLAIRAAILAAAVAAVAGPILVTASRRRAWDARTIRTEVADANLREGLTRAVAWLDAQPPGRRVLVLLSTFPLGSIDANDVAAVPAHIGLQFQRTGTLPDRRIVRDSVIVNGSIVEREITLAGDRTSVRDSGVRGPAPSTGRSARVSFGARPSGATPPHAAWMADAAAAIARVMGSRGTLTFSADGDRLLVSTPAKADDPIAGELTRIVADAMAPARDRTGDEVVSIDDAQLRRWTRDPGPAPAPRADTIARDDRRWLWGLVLILLALEAWMRRARRASAPARVEQARVA